MSWAPGIVVDGRIDPQAWAEAFEARRFVGFCRDGGPCFVVPCGREPVERAGGRVWFTSRCSRCGHETTAPDGRVAPRQTAGTGSPMPAYVRQLVR